METIVAESVEFEGGAMNPRAKQDEAEQAALYSLAKGAGHERTSGAGQASKTIV